MSLIPIFSSYLGLNLAVAVGFSGIFVMSKIGAFNPGQLLRLNHWTLILASVISVLALTISAPKPFSPVVRMWSAPSSREYSKPNPGAAVSEFIESGRSGVQVGDWQIQWVLAFALAFVAGAGGSRFLRDLLRLRRILRRTFSIRRIGRVRISVSETADIPFAVWLGRAYVVIPMRMLVNRTDYRIAVLHELQHHRQGDTRWLFAMEIMKWICFWNPLIHVWNRLFCEIQEFACDEAMVGRKRTSSLAYSRCLLEAAQTAFHSEPPPACATGMTFGRERHLITRRIEKMLNEKKLPARKSAAIGVAAVMAVLMSASAFAAKGLVQDRRVTMAQAEAMANHARGQSNFPIVVNDLVLGELNRFIGTPDGRDFMRNSLARMENYRTMVQAKLDQYQLPPELLAIPIIESGYQNLPQDNHQGHGAGLWMFIASTARNFGLKVDANSDDRLDTGIETDAGARYLSSLNLQFRDWLLAVFAYNVGERHVHDGIEATGSHDAWTLIRNGYENDNHYLAKVMAAVLIMKNPDSVN